MRRGTRWVTDLPIRRKLRLLGVGTVLPLVLLVALSVTTYLTISAEAEKTVDLGRRGDAALEAGAHIDALLLVQNSLFRLSTLASDPPGGILDDAVMGQAREAFQEFDDTARDLAGGTLLPVQPELDEFRHQLLQELPRLLDDRLETRRYFEDEFTRLEALTYDFQDQLTSLADSGILLSQTRYIFAVLTVLQNRRQAYVDDRSQTLLLTRRAEWQLEAARRPAYSRLATAFLAAHTSLVPTLEAWMGAQARLDLEMLRYTQGQRMRSEGISQGLTEIKRSYLAQVQAGLGERATAQTSLRNQNLSTVLGLLGFGLAGVLVLLWVLAVFEWGLVVPLSLATGWAARIREGDYSARLALDRRDEFGTLALALDHMALVVSQKTEESDTLNRTLERTVVQRTEHLTQTLKNLEEAQARLVNSEKLAVLGTLAAGMAHELNTPLAAILSADHSILEFFRDRWGSAQDAYDSLDDHDRELFRAVVAASFLRDRLDQARPPRVRMKALVEELAALGATDALTVAEQWVDLGLASDQTLHPSVTQALQGEKILNLAVEVASLRKMAQIIEVAGVQASRVVDALRPYMARGALQPSGEADVDFSLKAALLSVMDLIGPHHFRKIEVHWDVADDLIVHGPQSMLTQVWINLITNALEAMSHQGTLSLEAVIGETGWTTRIRDSGPGVPAEVKTRIFEPFFTTKKDHGGLGLGLDICRRLVEGRGGRLWFESAPGNTVFEVFLPRA